MYDTCFSVVIIIIAGLAYFRAQTFLTTAKFFPSFLSVATILLSVLVIVNAIKEKKTKLNNENQTDGDQDPIEENGKRNYLNVVKIIALLIAYFVGFQLIGYVIPTIILIIVGAYVLGYRNYKVLVSVSVILSISLFLLFSKVFFVKFPGVF